MKGTKQSRRLAKQLFKSCQVDDRLNADRVRKAVSLLIEQKPRGYFGILQYLQRLVKLDEASRSARVESAVALGQAQQQDVRNSLKRLKGGDVTVITRLGQSTADMARGGRSGFFTRFAFPETVEFLQEMGSTLECLHTHFLDTGDFCPLAGVDDPWAPRTEEDDQSPAVARTSTRRPGGGVR